MKKNSQDDRPLSNGHSSLEREAIMDRYALIGRVARTIAHEVRNPLTNINLSVEQLKSEIPDNEYADMFLAMVQRNSDRINQIVSALLDAIRIGDIHRDQVDVAGMVEGVVESLREQIESKKIEVKQELPRQILTLDKKKFQQAMGNIFLNALEAMEEEGVLKIRGEFTENEYLIQVQDDGRGIPESDLEKVFEPYFTTKQKGQGLGLTFAQNVILAHGGTVKLHQLPTKGVSVTILLPVNI